MTTSPQSDPAPSLGAAVLNTPPRCSTLELILSEDRQERAESKDDDGPWARLLEALARLLGFPVPQPVPVRVRR